MPGAEVQFDTNIEDASLSRTVKGDEIVRMAQVIGLDTTVNNPDELLKLAVDASRIVVGVDFHPSLTNLVCTGITAKHMTRSPSKVGLAITYGIPIFDFQTGDIDTDQPQITGGVVVQSVTTSRDARGNAILLHHGFPEQPKFYRLDENGQKEKNPKHPDNGGTLDPDSIQQFPFLIRQLESVAKIEVLRPMYTFGLTRRESVSPARKARIHVGTTNLRTWFGFFNQRILCTGITFASSDGGVTFNTTYSFQENREGWLADVAIIDPETGEFAEGVPNAATNLVHPLTGVLNTSKQSRWKVQVYRTTDFNNLGLLNVTPRR